MREAKKEAAERPLSRVSATRDSRWTSIASTVYLELLASGPSSEWLSEKGG